MTSPFSMLQIRGLSSDYRPLGLGSFTISSRILSMVVGVVCRIIMVHGNSVVPVQSAL